MEVCVRDGLALVTLDVDFANIAAYPPGSHHGVFVIRPGHLDAKTVREVADRFLRTEDLDRFRGSIVIIEPGRIRVRTPGPGD